MSDVFRKEYRPITESQKSWIISFKDQAETLHITFESCLDALTESDKRMMALAKTNLEQAVMWSVKAIT